MTSVKIYDSGVLCEYEISVKSMIMRFFIYMNIRIYMKKLLYQNYSSFEMFNFKEIKS